MKTLFLLAGAAALASAGPALAKPSHAKHGHKGQHARIFDGDRDFVGYGRQGCPPGLAKKNPQCMPPGQYKKLAVGQRLPYGYNGLLGYNALPYDLRNHYGAQLDPYSRYAYDGGHYYRVDPRTMIVQQILGAILR